MALGAAVRGEGMRLREDMDLSLAKRHGYGPSALAKQRLEQLLLALGPLEAIHQGRHVLSPSRLYIALSEVPRV
jgi:hypothetical protein